MEASALPRRHRLPLTRSRRMLSMLGDERLVEQVRRGNEAAFEVVFDRYHRSILSFSRHMLGTREEAEDAVQQTFVSAYNDLVSSDRPVNLKPWLFTIARNRCLSMLRARRERPAEIPEIATDGLADEVQRRHDLRELISDLGGLPENQRAALILSELGGLSHADIGAVLEVEPVKVKSLVFQARSSLIETRNAREIPCEEIREQLATLSGGALRRGPLRRHLKVCEGCRRFRDDVRRQRAMMAAVLPVVPTVALKKAALAAVGIGGGKAGGGLIAAAGAGKAATGGAAAASGGAASGGAAASGVGGGIGSLLAGGTAAKVATVAVLAGGSAAGGVAITDGGSERAARPDAPAAQDQSAAGESEPSGPGGSGFVPGSAAPDDDSGDRSGDGARRTGAGRQKARGKLAPGERRGRDRGGARGGRKGRRGRGGRGEDGVRRRGANGRRGAGHRQGRRRNHGRTRRNAGRPRTPPARRRAQRPRSPQRPPVRAPDPAVETDTGTGDAGQTDSSREPRPRPPRVPRVDETAASG